MVRAQFYASAPRLRSSFVAVSLPLVVFDRTTASRLITALRKAVQPRFACIRSSALVTGGQTSVLVLVHIGQIHSDRTQGP